MMIRRALYKLTALLPCKLILDDYLERYHVGVIFGVTVWLHRFVGPDIKEEVHDHPWRALSIVICGGYMDQRVNGSNLGIRSQTKKVRFFNIIGPNLYHRVISAKPETWTIILRGRRTKKDDGSLKGWGFLRERGAMISFEKAPDSDDVWYKSAPIGALSGRAKMVGYEQKK